MKKVTTVYGRCECGTGKVKLTQEALQNGSKVIRVSKCTDCPRQYPIKGFEKLERIKAN